MGQETDSKKPQPLIPTGCVLEDVNEGGLAKQAHLEYVPLN